jgi:hypothetical protein
MTCRRTFCASSLPHWDVTLQVASATHTGTLVVSSPQMASFGRGYSLQDKLGFSIKVGANLDDFLAIHTPLILVI